MKHIYSASVLVAFLWLMPLFTPAALANELVYRSNNLNSSVPDAVFLEHSINSPGRILGKSILILIPASEPGDESAHIYQAIAPVTRLADIVNEQIRTPVKTLLKGEYRGGVDPYTEGTVYQADWSDKGVKLGIKYQF